MNDASNHDFIFIQAPTYRKPTGSQVESTKGDPMAMPIGGLFLCESLLRRGGNPYILQGEVEEIIAQLDDKISGSTIAIGISSFSGDMLKSAMLIAGYIRDKHPEIPLIWGGVHPTAVRTQTLMSPLVDYIVWGEGENTLPRLLDAITAGAAIHELEGIPGIGFKNDGKPHLTPRPDYTDLDRVFRLPYHLTDIERIARKMLIGGDRWFPAMSARGCPFKCRFCSNSSKKWPNTRVRYHSLEHIENDITTLIDDYGADAIGFNDEITLLNEKRVIALCEMLNGLKKQLIYRLTCRVDVLDKLSDSTLKLLRDSGFVAIAYGVESGSQRILDLMNKGITPALAIKTNERLKRFGFYQSYNFMTALPSETIEEMKSTLRLLVKIGRNNKESPYPFTRLMPFIPLPDTELFDTALTYGFVPPKDMEGWTNLDFKNVVERRQSMRPWLTHEQAVFVEQAMDAVAQTSIHYTGADADHDLIDRKLDEIEQLAQ